ncbi:pentapeptide repeat-containing protein [Isosphaeraceae bacterium EP7]
MTIQQADAPPDADRPPPEVYEALAAATPAERAEIVLRLIEEHPRNRLVLPARDGKPAMLDGVDLGPEALERLGGRRASAPWFDPATGGAVLHNADLRGASLRKANLRRASLSGSNLEGARLGEAMLENARLDEANLKDADLAAAHLSGAILGKADLRGAMLEEAELDGASLRFADLSGATLEEADLQRVDLWGANLGGATLTKSDLRDARFDEADLRRSDLSGANLRGAILKSTDLREANLRGSDLREAELLGANFGGAILRDSKLQELDLTVCDISGVHLSGANLDGARFGREQIGDAIGEERAEVYDQARKGYLVLERAFGNQGDHDASAWAYRKRRRMQKLLARNRGKAALAAHDWPQAIRSYATYITDQSVEWICDYGESIPRVFGSVLMLYFIFIIIYGVTGSVAREHETPTGPHFLTTRNPVDLAIFSMLAMTTGSIGIRLLPASDLALTLVGVHVFLGVALIGLLGFVLGNRIRR